MAVQVDAGALVADRVLLEHGAGAILGLERLQLPVREPAPGGLLSGEGEVAGAVAGLDPPELLPAGWREAVRDQPVIARCGGVLAVVELGREPVGAVVSEVVLAPGADERAVGLLFAVVLAADDVVVAVVGVARRRPLSRALLYSPQGDREDLSLWSLGRIASRTMSPKPIPPAAR